MNSIVALGIDVGSATTKLVGIDATGEMVFHRLEPSDPHVEGQVARLLEAVAYTAETPLVATGYGRGLVHQSNRRITEITCHARGITRTLGHGGTLVDIGGQDSKVMALDASGRVLDFAMNDKCAAGTGRFLENTAGRLSVALDDIGPLALSTEAEVAISSTCTVFAESEVISLIAHGIPIASILRGLHRSLVKRVVAMIRTVGLTPPLMLSGGVVRNPAVRHMLAGETGQPVTMPDHPQLIGAYGAALLALEMGGGRPSDPTERRP
jgi:predicted CoA-substrate-specific enzyme activase